MRRSEAQSPGHEILVVDDDPRILEIMAEALIDEGYRVRRAPDGLAALAEVARATPDLVVTDIVMPRLDGVELARRLHAMPHPVPVVLVSAVTVPPADEDVAFAAKPFDMDHFLAIVARALEAPPPPTAKPRRPRRLG